MQPQGIRRAEIDEESSVRRDERVVAVQKINAERAPRKRHDEFCGFACRGQGLCRDEYHAERHGFREHEGIVVAIQMPRPFSVACSCGDGGYDGVVEQRAHDVHHRPEGRLAF